MSILYQIPTFCHANRSSALLERYKTYTMLIWNLHFDDQISHRNVYANNVLQIISCFCSMQMAYRYFCWDFAFQLSNNQFHKLFKFHFGSYICCLLVNTSISVNHLKILTPKPVISCGHIGWYQCKYSCEHSYFCTWLQKIHLQDHTDLNEVSILSHSIQWKISY